MKPGLSKSAQEKKAKLSKPDRQSDFQGSEQINFQTSEAAFNDAPIKSKRKERKLESTDSNEVEINFSECSKTISKIEDTILRVATN